MKDRITRFSITHINRDGLREITGPNQGRRFFDDRNLAENRLSDFLSNNAKDTLLGIFGPQSEGAFWIDPIECWANGDAVGIFVKDSVADKAFYAKLGIKTKGD